MGKSRNTTKLLTEQEYNKELRRIQQFLRRASKRGFIWSDNVIPKKPKKVTEKSVAKLKRLTPDVLYKKGQYVDQSTGELLSGVKGRALERKTATEKRKQTLRNKKPKKHKTTKDTDTTKTKSKKQPKQDEVQIEAPTPTPTPEPKAESDYIYDPDDEYDSGADEYYPSFTDIVLSNFLATLKQFPNAEGVHLLLHWYDSLIADNGRTAVAQMLQEGAANGIVLNWETVYKATATKTYMTEMMNYLPDQGKFYSDMIMDRMEQYEWWEMPE